jgi:hypothetical protein
LIYEIDGNGTNGDMISLFHFPIWRLIEAKYGIFHGIKRMGHGRAKETLCRSGVGSEHQLPAIAAAAMEALCMRS